MEDAVAEKFTLFGSSDDAETDSGKGNNSLDEDFFEEFSFDDFDYDDALGEDSGNEENIPPDTQSSAEDEKPAAKPVQSDPAPITQSSESADDHYEDLLKGAGTLVPQSEIEPDDPMLSEFESALAAEIQRVTREQEAEKKRIAAIRAARFAENESARRAIEERNAQAYVSGESIKSGGWFENEKRGGWSRRRRGSQPVSEIGRTGAQNPYSAGVSGNAGPDKGIGFANNGMDEEELRAQEEARRIAREQERARAAAARAERVKAAKAAQIEAEKQAALAREREAELKRLAAERAAKEEEEARARAAAEEQLAREIAEREEQNRRDREEEDRRDLAEKSHAIEIPDDDDYYDDDDRGHGRTVVTVSVLLVILLLGVGAAMTYFWSNLSVNRPGSGAANTSQTTEDAGQGEEAAAASENEMTPEESRYLEESRAAQAAFEEEQRAALARAEELEKEERAAMMAEAGLEGLPDISTRDLSEYLTEMPAEGASICTTDNTLYSYDQMVKDLYFLEVRYGDYIKTDIIGQTLDQRAIYQALIGNANASKHIVVFYSLAATDYIDTVLAMNQLEVYCKARKNGTSYKNHSIDSIFEDVCIHVIPMANPDGIAVCQYGLDALRTDEARAAVQAAYDSDLAAGRTTEPIENYLMKFRANANGVDLGANFSNGWNEYNAGPETQSASGYKGIAPFSEPETQALANLVDSVSCAAVIGYGTTGSTIDYGYGYAGPAQQGVSNVTEIGVEGLVSSLAAKTGYTAIEIIPTLDGAYTGGAAGYFLHEKQIPAVMIHAGNGEAPIDVTEMSSIWSANSEILQMIGNLYTNGL